MKLLPIFLAPSWLSLTNIWASYGRSVLLMTPLPITLCGPIPHTLVRGLFREPPALQETERKILLPLPNGTKPRRQHLSVLTLDPSFVTHKQTLRSLQFGFENADSNERRGSRNVLRVESCVELAGWRQRLPCWRFRWVLDWPFISDFYNPSSLPEMVRPSINCHAECKLGIH